LHDQLLPGRGYVQQLVLFQPCGVIFIIGGF
jgi:hypothetical protein